MLRDFVETRLDANEIGDLLTMAGFELEGIEEVEGESVLDIKVVSNRGDGLSVFGLSREVLAKDQNSKPTELYNRAVAGFTIGDETDTEISKKTNVTIESEACTRYACRLFENTKNESSPAWLQKRLRQAGLRPLGILVDLSNYVMLELGQPLHAFDQDTLAERRIVVRGATPGEKLTTLNGIAHELQPHHLMICDAKSAVAVAGVMGGAETEVSDSTKNVLLESAHFVSNSVRKTRKELGLSTDASYRFERSVDPNGVVRGLNRFANLLQEATGQNGVVPGVLDVFSTHPATGKVNVRVSKAFKLLGMNVTAVEVKSYLEGLGFSVSGSGEPFEVELPSWRPDIVREEDLIEEIGRVHGYEKIPILPPSGSTPVGGLHGLEKVREEIKVCLLRHGLVQTISHSLRDVHPLDSPNWEAIGPNNPGSPEMAFLRTSLWPSLSDAALRNGARDGHLFEIGRVHGSVYGKVVEGQRIAVLSTGKLSYPHWTNDDQSEADFYSMKGIVEFICTILGGKHEFDTSELDSRLHPTKQASIIMNGQSIGVFGQIHPTLAEEIGLPHATFLAAIDLEAGFSAVQRDLKLRPISRNPAVRRDIAILIATRIPYAEIEKSVQKAAGEVLEKCWLSDVYTGRGIDLGFHSLTIALQLRKLGENFTDEEANSVRDSVVAALVTLGGKQR